MSEHDRDLEQLLRSALDAEARRQEPAGDGLARIRTRVQKRRSWARWMKPTLALAGAAAIVAALIAAPSYLTASKNGKLDLADPAAPGRSVELSPSVSPSTGPAATPSGAWGTPIGGDTALPDRVAIWPYPSRRVGHDKADADIAARRFPNLADAGQIAVDFVASFVGTNQNLTASRLGRADPGVAMLVQRKDPATGAQVPVSNVFLVRVRVGDDAPYVVIAATRSSLGDSLTLAPLPKLSGTKTFSVAGTVKRDAAPDDVRVRVALREPGSAEDLGLGTATASPASPATPAGAGGAGQRAWSLDLSPFRQLTTSGVVAAWTTDSHGNVEEFVAAPITAG